MLVIADFFLPLTSSNVLSFEKVQNFFGFLLTYSYFCTRKEYKNRN